MGIWRNPLERIEEAQRERFVSTGHGSLASGLGEVAVGGTGGGMLRGNEGTRARVLTGCVIKKQ